MKFLKIFMIQIFENVSVKIVNDTLQINVIEFPIIENIFLRG